MEYCCYLGMSKTSWQTGKLRMNEDLRNLSKDQLYHWVHWWDISKIQRDKARIHQFGKKVFPGIFLGYALIAVRIWKGDILVADIEELESWTYQKFVEKTEYKRSHDNPNKWWICISYGRWLSKITRKKLRIPRNLSETGVHRKERESQWRISWR